MGFNEDFSSGFNAATSNGLADKNKRKGDEQMKAENQAALPPGAAPGGVAGTLMGLMNQAGDAMGGVYDDLMGTKKKIGADQ